MIYKVLTTKGEYLVDAKSAKKAHTKVLTQLHKDFLSISKKDIISTIQV